MTPAVIMNNEDCERRRHWTTLSPPRRHPHPQDRLDRWQTAATIAALLLLGAAVLAAVL